MFDQHFAVDSFAAHERPVSRAEIPHEQAVAFDEQLTVLPTHERVREWQRCLARPAQNCWQVWTEFIAFGSTADND
jgi:hypothetical protein